MTEYENKIALIEKMGLNTSPLRLEYEKKVHKLRSMPEKLKAEGYTEDQIARAMHEKRRELGRQYKEAAFIFGILGMLIYNGIKIYETRRMTDVVEEDEE